MNEATEALQPDPVQADPAPPVEIDPVDTASAQENDKPDQADVERDDKGRFKGAQVRIDELTRKRHDAEREAAYWKGVATQGKESPAPAAPEKPTPDKFDDYGAYVEALAEFKADEKIAKVLGERDAKAAEKQTADARTAAWNERQTAALSTMPDFDEVVGASNAPIAAHVADAIMESEHGPALAYHFGKHPEELQRLNSLPPRQADREIGRLEERLSAPTVEAAADPVRTSNTPKPAALISNQGRSNTPNPENMTQAQYEAHRRKQGASWAR